jgi:hypothetical protein
MGSEIITFASLNLCSTFSIISVNSNIVQLETRLTEKGNKRQEIELSKSDMTKLLKRKMKNFIS